jgi:hypothetical protein
MTGVFSPVCMEVAGEATSFGCIHKATSVEIGGEACNSIVWRFLLINNLLNGKPSKPVELSKLSVLVPLDTL